MNTVDCDHLVLEFARREYSELEVLKEVNPSIRIGVGVIDIKDNAVEPADTVASRIERAVNTLGADRISYAHPDCGFWMLPRNVADRKMQALITGRDRFVSGST